MKNLLVCAVVGLGGASLFGLAMVELLVPREQMKVEDDPAFKKLESDNHKLRMEIDTLRRELMRRPVQQPEIIPAGGPDAIPPQRLPTAPVQP